MTDDGQHISPEDLTLHALQAFSRENGESVGMHIAECAVCREEIAAVNGDLALVALTVARRPIPQGAKERFMQRLAAAGPAGGMRRTETPVVPIDRRGKRAEWFPWSAVAALLLLAIGLGAQVMRLSEKLRGETEQAAQLAESNRALGEKNAHAQAVLELMTAPRAQRAVLMAATSRPVPVGRAVYLAESGGLIFQGSNLARLPEGKTYELWVIPANGKAPMAAGMFRPDARGDASVMMPQLPKGVPAKAFGVTIEGAGGSQTPTMPIVLSGAASAGE